MGGVMKTCVVKFIRKGDAGDPAVTYRIQLLSATAHVDTDKVMRGAITWNVIKEVSGVETYINSSTGTHQCKLSSASSWSTAGSSGNNFNDNGLINGVSFSTAGSPTHLLIRFVLGGNVKCTLAVGISVDGVKGDGVNPNILLRTIFDRGIDPVKEAWTSNWSYVGIDGASDTVVQGRKSIRINATNAGSDVDFQQNVYGRIKVSTWYTLSFNVFATAAWHFFIYNATNSTSVIDLSAGYIIDGEAVSTSAIDGKIVFASEWAGTRHSITFKTRSSFSNTNANILFRCLSGKQLAICMPKLEEGKVATAYVAHEDDQKGDQGNPSTVPGPRGYRGPALRGPQDWAQMDVGFQFYKGDADTQEPYEDFVVYNGTYYKCKKTHTKTSTNYPGSTADTNNGYWELSSKVGIVASNIFFGEHGYFGDAIISGEWMISTNGTIDGTDYNNRATYQGVLAYSLFNPNNPLGSTNKKYESTTAKTFTASDSTKAWTTLTLESGKVYYLSVKGYGGSSSGYYVRLRNTSTGTTYAPVLINSTSEVTRTGYIKPTATGTYSLEIYNPNGISGTVSSITLTQKDFAPNYCVDLLTGKTYQCDAYVKGQIVATGGNITGTLTVGTYGANTNSIRIVPDSTNPSIVGYVGTTEVFRLGTSVNYDGSANPTVKVGRSFLRESGLYILDADGSNCRAYGTRFIVERVVSSLHYPFSIDITSNKKVVLKANGKAMWPTTKSEVGWGGVYVDGDVLKVNMDG